jgi:pilus assembly protein FimV
MMRIGLARVLVAFLLLPGISHALGLGDVRLNSPLNAPLDAEIELVNATPEDLATLDARLASKETFARYGLDWPPFMASVTVTRDRSANGSQVLRVRSTDTVTEPFLTLLIEASWARGRMVREYTVLLDPPVFAPNAAAAAPVPAPTVAPGETTGQIARPAPEQAPSPMPSDVPAGGGDSYEVQRGDSLSAIARRLASSTGARTDQLMVSIYRGNSQAFEGDMNRLRAGSVLRIPSSSEIAAVSPSEASDEVRRMAGSWAASAGSGSGRLRLVPPSDSAATAGSGTDNSAEVAELQGRVRELEGQLTESKRMLELRNTELADLQAKLAASQQRPVPAPAETPAPQPEPTEAVPTPEATTPDATTPEAAAPQAVEPTPEQAAPAETPPKKPARRPKPATPAADAGESSDDSLIGYWPYALGALALLVLGLVFAKSRGKRKTAEFDDRLGQLAEQGEDRLSEPMPSISDTGRMQAPMSAAAVPDDILVEESGTHRALQETQDIPLTPTVRTDETISSETAVNLDQGDPLAEADFHMAYGLYDQAADLVRIAIQREPARRDLKLKLLEVFFVWGNRELFLATARDLADTRGSADAGEWEKIVIMGKQIAPEDPMFSEGGAGGAVGVDLNLDAGGGNVDFDPFDVSSRLDVTGGGTSDPVDLDLGNALRDPDATGEGLHLPDREASGQTTREMTVKMTPAGSEAPTVEQPALRPLDEPTIREKVDNAMRRKLSSEQTAELALDDLGLELGSLEQTDSSLGLKPIGGAPGPDANAPTMVAGLDENSQRLLRAAAARQAGNGSADDSQLTEHGASGTWFLTERELGGDVDLTKGRSIDPGSTASLAKLEIPDEGFDISSTSRLAAIDRNNLDFPVEPTREQPAMGSRKVDLDLGGGTIDLPGSPTEELAVPDLEPVTLSEVGTKLDLARAYVDMGDPDGARNILNEVLSEGSASQKQEAQRLLESLPG